MSDQLFVNKISRKTSNDLASVTKGGIRHFIFLAAIGTATIGLLWLIAWAAMDVTDLLDEAF